jgi:hypothetical protein
VFPIRRGSTRSCLLAANQASLPIVAVWHAPSAARLCYHQCVSLRPLPIQHLAQPSCIAILGEGNRFCAFSPCQESKGHLLHPILPRSSALRPTLARRSAPNASLCNLRIHHLALRVQSHSGFALLSPTPSSLLHAASCQAWRPSAGIMLSATLTSQNVDVTQPAVTRSYSVSSSASVSRLSGTPMYHMSCIHYPPTNARLLSHACPKLSRTRSGATCDTCPVSNSRGRCPSRVVDTCV